MQARSAAYIGCSGSIASGMRRSRASSSNCGDAFGDLRAGARDVAVRRLAGERTGQAADHQHQAGRVQRAGFVERAAVVVARGLARRGIGVREQAAAAIARKLEAEGLDLARDRVEAGGMHLVAPRRDGTDAARGTGIEDLRQRPILAALLAHGGGVDRQPAVVLREVAHGHRVGCVSAWSRVSPPRARPSRSACGAPRDRAVRSSRRRRPGGTARPGAAASACSAVHRP